MTDTVRFVRRNRVDERSAALIATVGAVLAMVADAAPTGTLVVDKVLVFAATWVVIWASASASWWVGALAAGVGAVVALDPIIAAIGGVGFAAGLYIGVTRRDGGESRAVVGAIAVNVLIRSELVGFFGLSAIIGIILGLLLLVLGLIRRKKTVRRRGWTGLGIAGGLAVIALLGLGIAASAARPNIDSGADSARRGLDLLDAGDYAAAADALDQAAVGFRSVGDDLGGGFAASARLVPVVSQNVRAGADLADVAGDGLAQAAASLRLVDEADLGVQAGAIDLASIGTIEVPLAEVQTVLGQLRGAIDDARSPWLVPPLGDELDRLEADLERQEPRLANAVDAVRLAPQLLGSERDRNYLVLFTSPAEARGLGGFVGNYAEVNVSGGRISVTDFARRSELEAAVRSADVRCVNCPEEFLTRYGRFGFTSGENGGVADRAWSNITMPAHFPFVAEVAAVLYPQSGGREIDGVIVMDPYVVQALMRYTGPIELPEFGVTVRPDDAADFILQEQYELAVDDADGSVANADRIDALQTLGEEVILRLITGTLPEPAELANDLAPLVDERRLLFWTRDAEESALFDEVGLLGSLPPLGDDGGFSVAVTNAGASKIDTFLHRVVDTRIEVDAQGRRRLIADVALTNEAPNSGLSDYVLGNSLDLPAGTSRLWVSFYGPSSLATATLDGEPFGLEPLTEAGWGAYAHYLTLESGQTAQYTLEFALDTEAEAVVRSTADGDRVVVFEQPLARHEPE